jgi:hypothetical protein
MYGIKTQLERANKRGIKGQRAQKERARKRGKC